MYDFYLMHENTKVLKFNITVDINVFTNLCEFEIINKRYLPYPVKLAKEEINDLSIYKFLKNICLDAGLYKEYLKERDILKEKFGITDFEFWNKLGFIIDSTSQRIVGIMNTI